MVGSIEVKVKESSHCVEVNLSQTKGFEKQVIDQLIKETQSPLPCNHARCRGILLCEADQLSNETLMYVKWAIERNKGCSKIFFCCSDVSKLLLLSSFCTHVHLSPPSKQEIVEVLEYIAKQQEFDLSRRMAERIADNSKNNLRQAIRSLEASWKKSRLFEEDENKLLTGWEDDIADVAKKIVEEQSPKHCVTWQSEMVGSIEVKVKESSHCVEVNLSQTKGFEKQVIDQLIKETQSPLPCNHARCRGILLCEADQLSNETLMYVKWAIERNKGCSKIFFCCSDVSKLLLLSSFCTHVHLSPPSKQEIVEVLEYIAKQQEFDLSRRMAERIADNSKNNLRQAIRSLEASWKKSRLFEEDENKLLTGWEDDIADVAKKIVEEQSPKQLYIVRGKLKKLIEYDVSPNFIFKTLVDELKKFLDEELQRRVESFYADYNKMEEKPFVTEKGYGEEAVIKELHDPMRKNVNHFLKIEEFIAKFMSCYKGEANKKNYLPT
ncbi:replication factor C subunit 3-like [Cucurbita pepo subsp. pepo]|uniref:replication factor C subunit 3-like n=1 Tax=Cucurbita pepo subsp. pepo TaxID=3664 RepID=UPI000C9D36C2|nr:replication factor C subunit 3-like [Cucurbita pepo subsp. pepo]